MKTLLIILTATLLVACSGGQSEKNEYLKKYAGAYTVETTGIANSTEVEAYALNQNGGAIWMLIVSNAQGGAVKQAEKEGIWKASESEIKIYINGNSGMITEEYTLQNGTFVNKQNFKRYLKINN